MRKAPIAQALVAAKRRGVEVVVVLDKSQRTEPAEPLALVRPRGQPHSRAWINHVFVGSGRSVG